MSLLFNWEDLTPSAINLADDATSEDDVVVPIYGGPSGDISGGIILNKMPGKLLLGSGNVGLNSVVTGGTDWRFWAGNTTPGSAPFRVDEDGNLTATSAKIVGGQAIGTPSANGLYFGSDILGFWDQSETHWTVSLDNTGVLTVNKASGLVINSSGGVSVNDGGGISFASSNSTIDFVPDTTNGSLKIISDGGYPQLIANRTSESKWTGYGLSCDVNAQGWYIYMATNNPALHIGDGTTAFLSFMPGGDIVLSKHISFDVTMTNPTIGANNANAEIEFDCTNDLIKFNNADLIVSDGSYIGNGPTSSNPRIAFDDTHNYIEMLGGNVGINTTNPGDTLDVNGSLSKNSGTFNIPHPNPDKAEQGYRLRHSFVESPTRGDNLYRYKIEVINGQAIINLPDYHAFLNENYHVHVTPVDHFGVGYGVVSNDFSQCTIDVDLDGLYYVLLIATRKDEKAVEGWGDRGIEYKKIEKEM